MGLTLAEWKTVAEIFEATVTGLALLAGGTWTYLLFIKNREAVPRLAMDLRIETDALPGAERLLQVSIVLTNTGKTLVSVPGFTCRIYQVRPLHESTLKDPIIAGIPPAAETQGNPWERQVKWRRLYDYETTWDDQNRVEIEPGEGEILRCDFKLTGDIQAIEVYSYVSNEAKSGKSIGWHRTARFPLPESREERGGLAADTPTATGAGTPAGAAAALGTPTEGDTPVPTSATRTQAPLVAETPLAQQTEGP